MDLLRDDEEFDELIFVLNGIPRRLYQRFDYFNSFDNSNFRKRFRLTKETALFVLSLIEADIEHPYDHNNSIAPINQLLVFLRVCATGSHLCLVGDFAGMHFSTVSRIIKKVANALVSRARQFIKMPSRREEINSANLEFYEKARFPRVIRAIDCTHIRIQSPGGDDPEVFRNRKGFYSINTQIVSAPNLKVADIVARWPGSSHDSTIFNNSRIKRQFDNNEYPNCLLLGDSGYFLRPYLMTPILKPANRGEQLYNEAHIRTRVTIERLNGVLKKRFSILAYVCRLKLQTTIIIIVACAMLHNICVDQNDVEPPDPDDIALFLQVMEEDEVPNIPVNQVGPLQGIQVRRQLIHYFTTLDED